MEGQIQQVEFKDKDELVNEAPIEPDIGFEDNGKIGTPLPTEGINDPLMSARSGFDNLDSARGLLPDENFGTDLPSPIKVNQVASELANPDMFSVKGVTKSPSQDVLANIDSNQNTLKKPTLTLPPIDGHLVKPN